MLYALIGIYPSVFSQTRVPVYVSVSDGLVMLTTDVIINIYCKFKPKGKPS